MKRKNISADTALLEVARRHNTTVDEVRKEIRIAMAVAMCSPDPNVQKRWREIPHDGEVLTLEDFIAYAARKCLERLKAALLISSSYSLLMLSVPATAWADSPYGAADRRVRALRCPP